MKRIECKSIEGTIIGLVDAMISIARAVGPMIEKMGEDELTQGVHDALKDLTTDADMWKVLRGVQHRCIISEERADVLENYMNSLINKSNLTPEEIIMGVELLKT